MSDGEDRYFDQLAQAYMAQWEEELERKRLTLKKGNNMFNPTDIKTMAEAKAPLILVYSKHGVGKSSFLASIPKVFAIDFEGKLNKFEQLMRYTPKNFEDFRGILEWLLAQEKPEFKAVAIDTVDWLEMLIHQHICAGTGAKTINDPHVKATTFGNGYIMAANTFRYEVLPLLEAIRDKFNIPIVFTCHATVITSKDPDSEPFDIHELKLHEKLRAVISERVEAKIYAKLKQNVDQNGKPLPSKERVFICTPQKGIEAKNNLFLPDDFTVSYSAGWHDFINQLNTTKPLN